MSDLYWDVDFDRDMERIESELSEIADWVKAYPESAFPEPKDWDGLRTDLELAGFDLGLLYGVICRNILNRVSENATHGLECYHRVEKKIDASNLRARNAKNDAGRLRHLLNDSGIDGFMHVKKDRYDYAMEAAEAAGREEPNADDELNGFRTLIDAAIAANVEPPE